MRFTKFETTLMMKALEEYNSCHIGIQSDIYKLMQKLQSPDTVENVVIEQTTTPGTSVIDSIDDSVKSSVDLTILKPDLTEPPYAYIDGSFNEKTGVYSYGGFICCNGEVHKLQGNGNDADLVSMRNIAGELAGAYAAINKGLQLMLPSLLIYYDYLGLEHWANGVWQTKKDATKQYKAFVDSARQHMNITFVNVKGHTGIVGNEIADLLAKEAAGISISKYCS